jgi:two-component SAPR family response regulator
MSYQLKPITKEKLSKALEKAEMQLDIVKRAMSGERYESIGESYGISSRQRIEAIIKRLALDGKRADKNTA